MGPPTEAVNLKYLGPDAVHFDVRQRGWDEAIELGMDRFELAPAKQAAESKRGTHNQSIDPSRDPIAAACRSPIKA